MKLFSYLIVFSLGWSHVSLANDCAQVRKDLKSLQQAQEQIMKSLINNHETFASSLEEFSVSIKSSKTASRTIAQEMNESAQAFRHRGVQGRQTAIKLNLATKDLLSRALQCMK